MKKVLLVLFLAAIASMALVSCRPEEDDKIALGDLPSADFSIQPTADPNRFLLIATTPEAFLFQWDLGNGQKGDSSVIEAYYPNKGVYEVKLTAFSQGGYGKITKTVTVNADDPNACNGNLALLTNCGTKVWKLDPNPNALHVGPSLNETWWGNAAADVLARACHFNDEYVFSADGVFRYDNKGDFWADTDGSGNVTPPGLGLTPGCHLASEWPTAFKAWDSGTHSFSVVGNTLTVSGLGAWIGLYKVGTSAEVVEPQTSVSYTINELTANRMVISANLGFGFWRFTLVSN